MLGATAITVYNRLVVSRTETWQRSVIYGVRWEDRRGTGRVQGGLTPADSVTLYIPLTACARYVSPTDWLALADRFNRWTLQRGDLIVRGEVDEEVGVGFTPSALRAKYDSAVVIHTLDLNSAFGPLSHWRIGAS